MNKKDIKLGVDYAVTDDPGGVARGWRSAHVVSARVVRVEGREQRGNRTYTGIEVTWPVSLRVSNDPPSVQEYPTRFLHDGRYVICTWEEWEQRVADNAARTEAARLANEQARQAQTDADPYNRVRATRVFESIEKLTGKTINADLSDTTYHGQGVTLDGIRIGWIRHAQGINHEDVIVGVDFHLDLDTLATLLGVKVTDGE